MPSIVLGQPPLSGPQQVIAGAPYGYNFQAAGGLQLRWLSSGGNCYIGLSGGMTVNSGGMALSGSTGLLDGFPLAPGDSYYIPKLALSTLGTFNVYASFDPQASGIGRLYWEVY